MQLKLIYVFRFFPDQYVWTAQIKWCQQLREWKASLSVNTTELLSNIVVDIMAPEWPLGSPQTG